MCFPLFQVLKDLSMFVSPVRLCVRNLPDHINDQALKRVFAKCLEDKTAKITKMIPAPSATSVTLGSSDPSMGATAMVHCRSTTMIDVVCFSDRRWDKSISFMVVSGSNVTSVDKEGPVLT